MNSDTPARITAKVTLTPREYINGHNRDLIYRHVFKDAAEVLAHTITRDCMVETVHPVTGEHTFEVHLFVGTATQINRLVEQRADAISRGEPVRMELLI